MIPPEELTRLKELEKRYKDMRNLFVNFNRHQSYLESHSVIPTPRETPLNKTDKLTQEVYSSKHLVNTLLQRIDKLDRYSKKIDHESL